MEPSARRARIALTALGALCAAAPAAVMWGFTVDDALIPIAYARNLASGHGYRFTEHALPSDGVTPLPWVFLIAPLALGDALGALVRVKALGVLAWASGGGALGAAVAREAGEGGRARWLAGCALLVMAMVFPIGAYAASGMETGLATTLATWAAASCRRRPLLAAGLAGAAATLRPELVAWSLVVGVSAVVVEEEPPRRRGRTARAWIAAALAGGPFALCAAIRLLIFGRAAPLAVLAKPSDLSLGAMYAVAGAVVIVTPLLALAPVALARAKGPSLALALAFLAHVVAVAMAGGDWMPWARLFVPVAPSLVLVFAGAVATGVARWALVRLAGATVLAGWLLFSLAPQGRGVQADRAALVAVARPALARARVVAALDVGWVSAATPADIVDLAGLTDRSIASLGGGHTSKRVDTAMLLDRGTDVVVVYSERRVVEQRLLGEALFQAKFSRAERLAFGSRGAFYDVYRRVD